MAKNIFPVAGSAVFTATPEFDGTFVEFGPGTAQDECGVVVLQFAPDLDWVGQFIVMARRKGSPADEVTAPFIPVPYIEVNVNGAASDRHHTDAIVTSTGLIEVPAAGVSIAVLMSCSAGTCAVYISRLAGTPVAL